MRPLRIVLFILLSMAVANGQQPPEAKQGKGLELTIAVDLDAPATTLIFEARNTGDKDIHTTPIGTSGNWLEVQRPDGKTEKIREMVRISQPTVIKAGESRTWHFDLVREGGIKFDVPGQYRVTWHLTDLRLLGEWEARIVLVKSKAAVAEK